MGDKMSVCVDIADRLYDYTDEEKASEVVAEFQAQYDLDDSAVVAIWADSADPRRSELEKLIFDAVDKNGSAKRARDNVPGGIELIIDT